VIAITLYVGLKFVHVLLAIVAVGFNASYGVWLAGAANHHEHLDYVLRGVKKLDDRFANPAYGLLLVTGLWMVGVGPWDFKTDWIQAALTLYVLILILGLAGYTPALKRQITALETHGPNSPEYGAANKRAGIIAGILALLVIAIVYVMVTKPTF
jgi:uncharacterized membrane protein